MGQQVYLLSDPEIDFISDDIRKNTFINHTFVSPDSELTSEILLAMSQMCPTDYFYVIASNQEIIFPNFDFSFKPEDWDKEYVHIWNNDKTVRLFNKQNVLKNPTRYTDDAYFAGKVKIKNSFLKLYEFPDRDIVFISYDEANAEQNFNSLVARFPRGKRVHGIKGIFNAHRRAAELASSGMFFIVDADAEILTDFEFNYMPGPYARNTVHVWHSRNPINGLEYGYGGVKLFPTQLLLKYDGNPLDFTTAVSDNLKIIRQVSNITHFNTDPFSAWRAGFRECTKLSCKADAESVERLEGWCTLGADREFGDFVIAGANEGKAYGTAHKDQPELLGLINDYSWLEQRFSN